MAESITLTTPITKPAVTGLTPVNIDINYEAKSVSVQWRYSDGTLGSAAYTTPAHPSTPNRTGAQLIATMNTRNFSTNSLLKQMFQLLQTDGQIAAGTIAGTPD